MKLRVFQHILATASLPLSALATNNCKCGPSDACWPADDAWATLNSTVSGRLIRTHLPGSVCYTSQPDYSQESCQQIIANWTKSAFHSSDPASIDDPGYAGNSCNPIYANGTSTAGDPDAGERGCTLGKYPPYVVNATEASHVQAAVRFAKKWNLRLNVKNTGHGKSAAYGSLSIWTHHMKRFEFHSTFVPDACPAANNGTSASPHMAATLGAGIQDDEAYRAAAQHNAIVTGGTSKDVGVLGWSAGGGHGFFTGTRGMGADNIVAADVVLLSTGAAVTATACNEHAPLLWALRGGGGGTFGIMTALTVKAYPMPSAAAATFELTRRNGTGEAAWWRAVAEWHAELPGLKDAGWQGYYTVGGEPITLTGVFFLYDRPNGTAAALWKPARERMARAAAGVAAFTSSVVEAGPWIELYGTFPVVESTARGGGTRATRLLPRRAFDDVDALARTFEAIGPKQSAVPGRISNPSMSGCMVASPEPVDNALNPAWRDAVVHLLVSRSWDDAVPEDEARAAYDEMTNKTGYALRQLAPDAGAYFNEADNFEPNWQWSLFGPNYPRLRAIKQKYDPAGLLWCPHCVGSEDWIEESDGKLCKQSWAL